MKSHLLILAILVTLTATLALLFWQPAQEHDFVPSASSPTGGNFTLDSTDGPVSLSDFKGRIVTLYFGYTFCPDICPTSLGLLSTALSKFSSQQLAEIQPVFISIDPERDTLEHLQTYSRFFHESFIGLTGSKAAINRTAALYGAAYRKVESDSATGYIVDHSANLYLIDRQGNLAATLPHGTSSADIHAALNKLLTPEQANPTNAQ